MHIVLHGQWAMVNVSAYAQVVLPHPLMNWFLSYLSFRMIPIRTCQCRWDIYRSRTLCAMARACSLPVQQDTLDGISFVSEVRNLSRVRWIYTCIFGAGQCWHPVVRTSVDSGVSCSSFWLPNLFLWFCRPPSSHLTRVCRCIPNTHTHTHTGQHFVSILDFSSSYLIFCSLRGKKLSRKWESFLYSLFFPRPFKKINDNEHIGHTEKKCQAVTASVKQEKRVVFGQKCDGEHLMKNAHRECERWAWTQAAPWTNCSKFRSAFFIVRVRGALEIRRNN